MVHFSTGRIKSFRLPGQAGRTATSTVAQMDEMDILLERLANTANSVTH